MSAKWGWGWSQALLKAQIQGGPEGKEGGRVTEGESGGGRAALCLRQSPLWLGMPEVTCIQESGDSTVF